LQSPHQSHEQIGAQRNIILEEDEELAERINITST
jgi:hypothetical protein